MEHPENDDLYKGLKVNKGVADVPTVNPYLKKRIQRKEYTPAEFVEGILKGNITILSQAVTLVESSNTNTSKWHRKLSKNACRMQESLSVSASPEYREQVRAPRSMRSACT